MSKDDRKDNNRRKVPSWDGTPDAFDTYEVKLGIFLKTGPKWKESELISEAVSKLEGKAWQLIEQISEDERDKIDSKEVPLTFLRKNLLEAAVTELGKMFRRWQVFKRIGKESMKLYIMRHRKMLSKLEKALGQVDDGKELTSKLRKSIEEHCRKVQLEKPLSWKAASEKGSTTSRKKAPSDTASDAGTKKVWKSKAARRADDEESVAPGQGDGFGDDDENDEDPIEPGQSPESSWEKRWGTSSWWDQDWKWKVPELPKTNVEKLTDSLGVVAASITGDLEATRKLDEAVELIGSAWRTSALPPLLTGWHLLQRSGLNPQERATVVASASLQGQGGTASAINLERIEMALRTQWQDEELMQRDEKSGHLNRDKGKTVFAMKIQKLTLRVEETMTPTWQKIDSIQRMRVRNRMMLTLTCYRS